MSGTTGIGSADYDFNGDGTNQERTFTEGTDAITSLRSAVAGGLEPLRWSPGLFLAAGDQVDFLDGATEASTIGKDDSTTSDRVTEYGTGGASELQMFGANDAEMAALLLLVDDGVSGYTNREALLNENYDSIALRYSTWDDVALLDVLVSGDYASSEPYSLCSMTMPGTSTGALTGVAISFVALGMLGLSMV